jgi:hypothetical protein
MTDQLYDSGSIDNSYLFSELPRSVRLFIGSEEWNRALCEIMGNTASLMSFRKRFFNRFNMFMIVKYMNFVHQDLMKKKPVTEAATELINKAGYDFDSDDPAILLGYYRSLEKEF